MKLRKIMLAAVVAAIVTVGSFAGISSLASDGKGSTALHGTWRVRLTPGSGQAEFDELMTFDAGGGIVESNNYPFFQLNLAAGPGHGTWSYDGRQHFPFTFIKFLFTPTGQAAGTMKVAGVITYSLETDTWSGPATVSICDSTVNNCNPIDVTVGQATRVVAGL